MLGGSRPARPRLWVTGSGKTTLARDLGRVTGLPWHSADDEIGWLPGWQQRPVEQQHRLAQALASRPEWILDTAYGVWRDMVLPRAQVVVALDYPRRVSLVRLLRRTARRVRTREPVCNGNVESLRQALSRDSIIGWHLRSFGRKRRRIREMAVDPSGPVLIHLTSPAETQRWLSGVQRHGLGPVP